MHKLFTRRQIRLNEIMKSANGMKDRAREHCTHNGHGQRGKIHFHDDKIREFAKTYFFRCCCSVFVRRCTKNNQSPLDMQNERRLFAWIYSFFFFLLSLSSSNENVPWTKRDEYCCYGYFILDSIFLGAFHIVAIVFHSDRCFISTWGE